MSYLTYEEYIGLGGSLDEAAFKRNVERACAMINIRTYNRLLGFEEVPSLVKIVCADVVDYISINSVEGTVAAKSQSAGGVSESITYKSAEEYASALDDLFAPLGAITMPNGTSIMYRGAMV